MAEDSNRSIRNRAVIVFVILAAAASWYLFKSPRPVPAPPGAGEKAPAQRSQQPSPVPDAVDPRAKAQSALEASARNLRTGAGPARARDILAEVQQALRPLPPEQASAVIQRFLASNTDAPTGLEFKVGRNGALENSPTLRTFLLDQLEQVDAAAAAAYARTILSSMDSPDEWAVALRSLAKGDPTEGGRQLAQQKLQEMLTNPAWQRQPSVGFLEAFDVAVHLRGTALLPTLTSLVQLQDNQAVAHAAYLAVDRLIIAEPASTLAELQSHPDMMQGREVTRANYFARADVRDEKQRQILEAYLLQPSLVPEELDKFAALYPSANFMISNNLLTRNDTPDGAWLADRDRESLRQVQRWLADARFARLQPQLRSMEQRLKQFLGQGGPAP